MVIKGLMDFDSSWYLCILEWLTKTQTKLKHTKIQEIKEHLHSWTNSKFRKLVQNVVQNVDQRVDQNVLMIVQKVVHKQTQNHQEREEHAKHTWHE